jgi:hypothetical protein
VLDVAQVVVLQVVAKVFVAVVGNDVAVATGGSGRETRGCRGCRGAVGRLGKECRRFRGAGGCCEAGDEVVVDIAGSVDVADGGCAYVVSDDVAALTDALGRVTGAVGSFSV